MKPLLSISIPTYNRAAFLDKALVNLTTQLTSEVEIVLSDDGSTDNTEDVAKKWQSKFPNQIIYFKKQQNERLDKNYITVVEKSNGKYCWFMSDDDMIVEGSITRILSELKKTTPVGKEKFIMLNYSRYDNEKEVVTIEKMIEFEDRTFTLDDFMGTKTPNSYFNFLGKNIIYMSIAVFPRELWLRYVNQSKPFIGTNFIHCFVFVYMIAKEKLDITYIGSPYVLYRSGNIRAWGNNVWKDFNDKFLVEARKAGVNSKVIRMMRSDYRRDIFKIKCKAVIKRLWK